MCAYGVSPASQSELDVQYLDDEANAYGYVLAATNWLGMCYEDEASSVAWLVRLLCVLDKPAYDHCVDCGFPYVSNCRQMQPFRAGRGRVNHGRGPHGLPRYPRSFPPR